jgi:hypothetical protein
MMKTFRTSIRLGRVAVVAVLATAAGVMVSAQKAPEKCGGADIATGPFAYTGYITGTATFNGSNAGTVATGFTVTAPTPAPDSPGVANVFAGQGQNACLGEALTSIGVIEIEKVGDAEGQSLETPVQLDRDSGLGQQIAAAFAFSPDSYLFTPADAVAIAVIVSNPAVSAGDYGDYLVKMGAHAPGAGVGVGAGPLFTLSLRPATATDTTPPVVSVSKPSGDETLGVVGVEIQAFDPVGPAATGLASISATIRSSGGAINNLPIAMSLSAPLPVPAGTTVTATGSFSPAGGSPSDQSGTSQALAFTALSRSGIGTYTIDASAVDGAGNTGSASRTFNVKYQIGFVKEFSTNPCQSGGNGSCTGQFDWTVNRSAVTSDGALMWDKTVVARLRRVGDSVVVASHVYGTGDPKDDVKFETSVYKTNFRRSEIGATGSTAYRLEIYFLDVDGSEVLQATSSIVTF